MGGLTERDREAVRASRLFEGADEACVGRMLKSAGAEVREYSRGEYILREDDENDRIMIVLSGAAAGERVGADGKTVTINELSPGGVFGDVLSGSSEKSPVDVRVTENCRVLSFAFAEALAGGDCGGATAAFVRNLTRDISDKFLALQRRVDILIKSSLRGKIALYLYELSRRSRGKSFVSPHDREAMARYLGCERSALSRELSRMKREGIIDYKLSSFSLIDAKLIETLAKS